MSVLLTAAADTPVVHRIWNLVDWLILQCDLSVNQSIAANIVGAILCIAAAYLLGSICPAILISKRFFGSDLREHGSKNAGMHNAFCAYGRGAAIAIFFAEFALGYVSVLVGRFIWGFNGSAIASFFVIFGNIFPLFHRLRGGKGMVTMLGVSLAIHPFVFLPLLLIFLLAVFATKLVAFGAMASSFLFPLLVNAFANLGLHVAMAVFGTAFLLYAHRQNFKRIQAGKEEKFFFSAFFQNDRNGGNE